MHSYWDSISPEIKSIIEKEIGHPIISSSLIIGWNRDYVKPETAFARQLMYNPPEDLDIDKRIYKDLIERHVEVPGKTYVVSFAQMLGRCMAESATGETFTETDDTTTTSVTPTSIGQAFGVLGLVNSSAYGLTVGSGTTAVSRTQTKLVTKIVHGATAGTLVYGAVSVSAVSNPSGSISRVQTTRSFTGNAGSTVSINEDALEGQIDGNVFCMMYRNVNNFGAVGAAQVVTATQNTDITS